MRVLEDCIQIRAPYFATDAQIRQFIDKNRAWIEKKQAQQAELSRIVPLTEDEIKAFIEQAKVDLPRRVAHFTPLVGVTVNRITIRGQKTRWGSCSAKGNLNLNFLLMLAPEEVRDSVVVHELCHLKEMNHSADFYKEVYRVFPQYDETHKWLKIHGEELLKKIK